MPTGTSYVSERQFVLTLRLRHPGLSKKILKKLPFSTRFCTVRFRLFLDHYRTNRHKTWYALPVGSHYAGLIVQLKRLGLFGTSAEYRHALRESGPLFDTILTNRLRGSTLEMLRQAK